MSELLPVCIKIVTTLLICRSKKQGLLQNEISSSCFMPWVLNGHRRIISLRKKGLSQLYLFQLEFESPFLRLETKNETVIEVG